MNIQPGKCLKCDTEIIRGNAPLSNYREMELKTDQDIIFAVGLCSDCTISSSEWDEVGKAVQASLPQIPLGNIIALISIKNVNTILMDLQGGKCFTCGDKIGETWVRNNGRIVCEMCKRDRPKTIVPPNVENKKNKLAGAMSKKEERRKGRKNVQMQGLREPARGDSVPKKPGKGVE